VKVLQISKFYPPVRGGIESATRELTEGLVRNGVPTDVLCAGRSWTTERSRLPTGCEVVRVAKWGSLLSTSMAPALIRHLKRMAPGSDVLHAHMPDPMSALALWITRPNARIVLHWHSDVIRQRHAMRLYRPLQTWLLRRADAIIATSQAYLEASEPLRPWKHKVRIIPIGVADRHAGTDNATIATIRQRFAGKRIVFALGRMAHYKGFDLLVDAASLLPPDITVLIGGTGDLQGHLAEKVAQLGLEGKVQLLGNIADPELPSYFAACDVFCLPSTGRAEAFGIAMVEAMMMGKPVVAADIPGSGVPWINVDGVTGLNVPVRQPPALAGALLLLLSNPALLQRMGLAARQRYLDEFTAERMTQRTIDLYRQSLQGPLG